MNILNYYKTAYEKAQGYFVLCAIPEERSKLLIKGNYHVSKLEDMLSKAEKLNGNYHLYSNIHPLKAIPQHGRGKEDDILGVALFATDVDAKDFIPDPEESMKAIAEKGGYKWTDELLIECKEKARGQIDNVCNEVDVPPSALIDSGHGFYPVFFLNEFVEFKDDKHREELKEVNRVLHKAFSADATFDFARILRILGTMNLKPGYPAPCELVEFHPERRYSIDDIRKFETLIDDDLFPETDKTDAAQEKAPVPPEEPSEDKEVSDSEIELLLNAVSLETRYMIETGKVPESCKIKDKSRSGRDQCIVARLKSDNASYEQVKAIFEKYPCGDKYREREDPDKYLKTSWNNAETETEIEPEADKQEKKKKKGFYPTAISKRLLAQNDFRWQYVTEQDQFYQYSNGVWTQIEDGYIEKAIRNILFKISPSWDRKNKRAEVIEALKDYLIDPEIQRRFDISTNPNFDLINVKNGMLDWKTGELKEHDKEYYSTCQLNVTYDPEAESDLWKRCLKEWIPDPQSRMFIQEFSGYSLIPDTSQHKAVILVGAGSNGKSTFLYTNEKLFGEDNLSSIPMRKLSERFEIARIQHKLVNICADIESGYIEHTANIQKVISGDTLRGELKYKPSFDFTPITRLWFSCNEIPKASNRSEAWYRRFEYITFPNRFEGDNKDPQLKQKLTEPEVLSAVLNWAVAGLRRLNNQGEFTISDEMKLTKQLYELENDNVAAFIDEMLELGVECNVPKTWLYDQYKDYCDETGTKPISKRRFETRIKANGIEEDRTSVKLCSFHHNFRCDIRDKNGYHICDLDDYESVTQRVFFGLDLKNGIDD